MPIGIALASGRFKRVIDKNSTIPLTRSFRLPAPREAGAPFIEMDVYQGDSDLIVDNEFLGSLRVPAACAGRKVDFVLNEECLLAVQVDEPGQGMQRAELATRDTPAQLKTELAKRAAEREAQAVPPREEPKGLLVSLRRIWGGD